jgi:hypothetical protein
MQYVSLPLFYSINHSLHKHHGFSFEDINNMYPFERDINISLINADLSKEVQQEAPTGPM